MSQPNKIPICVDSILVGRISQAEVNVSVYIERLSTKRMHQINVSSNVDGDVTVDTSDVKSWLFDNYSTFRFIITDQNKNFDCPLGS